LPQVFSLVSFDIYQILETRYSKMPKVNKPKRNSAASQGLSDAAAKTKAAHSIFKMNTDIGQHVLKNPGIAGRDCISLH
jgi:hypothetical protein